MGCLKSGNLLKIEQTGTSALSLFYVAPIYQTTSCASDTSCAQVTNFSYSDSTLSVVMASPPTITQDSVFSNACCPVTWLLDSANEVTGAQITRSTQDLVLAAKAETFHIKTTAALKFKLVYFDGSVNTSSNVLTRSTSIQCIADVTYKIDNVEQVSVFTKNPGIITTKDYSQCLGGGSVTLSCDQTSRPGYAVVSGQSITMDFTKRGTNDFVDQNYFVTCTHTSENSSSWYFTDAYQVDSIDCAKGLTVPTPAMSLGTQTIDVTSATTQKFQVKFGTSKSITVSAFTISSIPATYGKQCGELSYSVTCTTVANFVSQSSATVFALDTSKVSPGGSSVTVSMKLTISCAQFSNAIDYLFQVEVYECAATTGGITSFNVYYLIDGVASTVILPLTNASSFCLPFTFDFFDQSGTSQNKPSWLTYGNSLTPTLTIQTSDKTLIGEYRVRITVPALSPYTVSFYLKLAALAAPTLKYAAQATQGSSPWLAGVVSENYTLFYKWNVDAGTYANASTSFPLAYSMSIDGSSITEHKNSSITTKGMTWTADASGDYELGWKILADKTNQNGLQNGAHALVLTVSVTHVLIDGNTATRTATQTASLTLTVKDCTITSQFSAPTVPSTILFDYNKTALNASVSQKLNVNNPYSFFIGAFGNDSCDLTGACCCPLTYSGQAYRSDSTLISSVNGGVEILQLNQSDLKITSNQIDTMRSPLGTENFIQPITFKLTVSSTAGSAAVQTLKFDLVNCVQSPTLSQHNIAYFFDNTAAKTFELVWQSPSTDLDSTCLPKILITALNNVTYQQTGFDNYLSTTFGYSPSFITFNYSASPPSVTIQPFQQGFTQFIRDWPMIIRTFNGFLESNQGQSSFSDEKQFYLGICQLAEMTNNGVVIGQSTSFATTGTKTLLLQLSAIPSGEAGSICTSLIISYSLANSQSWMTLTTGATENTVTLNLTGIAAGTYSFDYVITYSTQNASGTKFKMHTRTKTITITAISCSTADWVFGSSWIALQDNSTPVASASQAKALAITLQAVFTSDQSAACGPTKYVQHIKINDGTTQAITSPCTDAFATCFGWQYHTDGQQFITIDLSKKVTSAVQLSVTIVTTYYNDLLTLAGGVTKEWPNLTITDCSRATLTIPDPKITMGSFSVGSTNTILKSAVFEGDKTITVQNFSYDQTVCVITYSLVTTDASLQSLIQTQTAQTFLFKASTKTVSNKLDIAMSLVLATPGVAEKTYSFTYTLYDCTTSTETSATYNYAAMLGASSPLDLPVTLAYSGSISYLEYCNTFVYMVQEATSSTWSSTPSWITLTNFNPITTVNGVNFNIKTSDSAYAGKYLIRKMLMVPGNQPVTHTLMICIYEPPSTLFTGVDATMKLQILDINESRCVNFNAWNAISRNPGCPSCASATCEPTTIPVTAYSFLRDGSALTTSYSTGGTSGFKYVDASPQKQLCWKMPDANLVLGNTYTMQYALTNILASSYSGSYKQTFTQDFSVQVISCSSFTVVDPSPWLLNKSTNIAVPATGDTIYFPASTYPTFEVQPYTNNSFCVNSGACCSMSFTSSTVQTFDASNNQLTGIMSSNVAVLSLADTNLPTLLGSQSQADLTVKVTMNTAYLSFLRSFTIKFVNCAVASQANLSYLINRTTTKTFSFAQANAACTGIIKIRNQDMSVLSKTWLTVSETSQSTLTINSNQVQIADSDEGDYSVTRYVNLVNSVTAYNKLDFKISLCKLTPPTNNGVDVSSTTSFDKFNSSGSVKLAAGSVSALTTCSGITYNVSGLATTWMTYNSSTNSVDLDLTKSTETASFTYTLTYNDGQLPTYKVDFTITVSVLNCSIVMPANWVSPKLDPTAFATTFTQDSQVSVTYTLQEANSQQSTNCGALTRTVTALISETGENASAYLNSNALEVTANLLGRTPTHPALTMTLTVALKNTNYSLTKTFTINFYDCRKPSGTINALADQQIEVGETKSLAQSTFTNVETKCSNFQILFAIELTVGSWSTVTAAGTPALIAAYTSTPGTAPTLDFQIKPDNSIRGKQYQCKMILKNRENVQIESAIFKLTVCKAEVTQAFISPSSTALTGNVFSLVRAITASDPKLQVIVSSAYQDPTQSQCTYTSVTIESLDTTLMTTTNGSQQVTLSIDSFKWVSGSQEYSHNLELKVWHGSEVVWFADKPHTFTVKIYDCEKDMSVSGSWVVESLPYADYEHYLFEEATGNYTLQITTPTRKYAAQCGTLSYEITTTDALANPNVAVDSATGLVTITTPADVFWGPAVIGVKIKNSYASISGSFKLKVFDCKHATISPGAQPSVNDMVSTSAIDWAYSWKPFETTFTPCVLDTYMVECEEGVENFGSGLCQRGFQINTSRLNTIAAALNGKTINALTIYAQYKNDTQISVDHEGEFTFTITAYQSRTPSNKASHQILVKITTPCDDVSNWILPLKQTFLGTCRTENGKTFCDDVHYTVFTTQSNPIVQFTHRFPYSCKLSYELKIKQAGIESNAPSPLLQLLDSTGAVAINDPAVLKIHTELNSDADYDKAELIIRATVVNRTGVAFAGAVQAETNQKLFVFNDCAYHRVPMENLGQSIDSTFFVSQHLMNNSSYVNTISLLTVHPRLVSDQKYCAIPDSALRLVQKNKPATLLTPFNTNLFTFVPDQLNNKNQLNIHASNDDQVSSVSCTLANMGTNSCPIDIEIEIIGVNGTFPVAATGKLTFKSECYLTLEYYNLLNGPSTDQWVWASSDMALFKQPYKIRDPQVQLTLPRVASFTLPSFNTSGKGFQDVCGQPVYSIPSLATNFTLVQPTMTSQPPILQVYSDEPTYADKDNPPTFIKSYPLSLSAVIPKTSTKIVYDTTQARTDAMTFDIQDLCYGLTYTKPSIWYNDGRNSARLSFILRVVQPVLFDRYAVTFINQEINEASLKTCGTVAYKPGVIRDKGGVIQWGTLKDPNQNQGSSQSFTVYSNNNNLRGIYNVTLTAYITDVKGGDLYPQSSSMVEVTIDDCYVKVYNATQPGPSNLNFNMNGKPQEMSFVDFYQEPACNYTQKFNITVFKIDRGSMPPFEEGSMPDPSPITLNRISKKVTLETNNAGLVNSTYQYWITGHLDNSRKYQGEQVFHWGPFQAQILESKFLIENTPPTVPDMQPGYTVFAGETQTVKFGRIFDFEGNKVTLSDWSVTSSASKWVKLSSSVKTDSLNSLSFDITPPSDSIDATFSIFFTLADNHLRKPMSADYVANFKVGEYVAKTKFNGWQQSQDKFAGKQQQFLDEQPPNGNPQKISISGGFVFEFDKPLNLTDLGNITLWNSTNDGQKYFEFELVPGDDRFFLENKQEYSYNWNITKVTNTAITFQFQFSEYQIISQRQTDSMRFKILKPEAFVSEINGKQTEFTSSVQRIPKQVRSIVQQQQIQTVTHQLDRFLKTLSASSFINIVLSSSLQFLWGMINALQVVVLTVLFNIKTPVNAQQIEVMILQMVQFDILKTQDQLQRVFKFDLNATPPLNSRFTEASYETSNFVLNMGDMFVMEGIYLILAGLVPLLKWLADRQSPKIERYLKSVKLLNNFARFYFESQLEICICALLNFRLMNKQSWRQPQLWFSNLCAVGNLCVLIVMPFILGYIAHKFHKGYHTDREYRKQYDDLFEELRGDRKLSMLYFTFFTLRRYAIACSLIALPENFLFQIFIQVFSSSLFLLYLLDSKPHKDVKQGKMEIFNEITVSVAGYFLFVFTDLCPDEERRYQAGWALVILILTNLMINVSIMMVESLFVYKRKIQTLWMNYKLRKLRQQILKAQEAENQRLAEQVRLQASQVRAPVLQEPSSNQPQSRRRSNSAIQRELEEQEKAQQIERQRQIEADFQQQRPQQYKQMQNERRLLNELEKSLGQQKSPQRGPQRSVKTVNNGRRISQEQDLEDFINEVNKHRTGQMTIDQPEDAYGYHRQDLDESGTELVLPYSRGTSHGASSQQSYPDRATKQKQQRSKSPFEVIQEYNSENEAKRQLFERKPSRMLSKYNQPKPKLDLAEQEMLNNNVWLKSGETFMPKQPDWFYELHPDYKTAKDYLDKKYNRQE